MHALEEGQRVRVQFGPGPTPNPLVRRVHKEDLAAGLVAQPDRVVECLGDLPDPLLALEESASQVRLQRAGDFRETIHRSSAQARASADSTGGKSNLLPVVEITGFLTIELEAEY